MQQHIKKDLQSVSTDHVFTQHIGLDKIEDRSLMRQYIGKIIVNIAVTIFKCIENSLNQRLSSFFLSNAWHLMILKILKNNLYQRMTTTYNMTRIIEGTYY